MVEVSKTDELLNGVQVELRVSVGAARPTLTELIHIEPDTVLALDKSLEDPVELYIGEKLVGTGVLEEMEGDSEGRLAVRVTTIGNPTETPT